MCENNVEIKGVATSEFVFDYAKHGCRFYKTYVCIDRYSGNQDLIPVITKEKNIIENIKDKAIYLKGQYRSRNSKGHLILYVYAYEVSMLYEEDYHNSITFDGYVCSEPIYRKTPLGKRITDMKIAVNLSNGNSVYLPVICWGKFARESKDYNIGNHVKVFGRIQSRSYKKAYEDYEEDRVAYEVSIMDIVKIE